MIYISGPITGNKNSKRQFARAEKWLLNRYTSSVVNPFNDFAGLEDMLGYSALIDVCCRIAAKAELIAVLPGWKNSYGCCLEVLTYLEAGGRIVQQINTYGVPSWVALIPPFDFNDREAHAAALKDACHQRIKEGPPTCSEK